MPTLEELALEDMNFDDDGTEQPAGLSALDAGMSAGYEDIPGAAEALEALTKSTEAARKALQEARARIVGRKYNRAIPLLAASAALGAPTRAGSTAESFAAMSGALTGPLREKAAFEEQQAKDILSVDTGIAGLDQQIAKSRLDLAAVRAKLLAQARNAPNEPVLEDGVPRYRSRQDARGKQVAYPPTAGTNISLSTQKSFYDTLGDKRAATVEDLFKAAELAPSNIERTRRVRQLLKEGAYTGTAAEIQLAIGKGLRKLGWNVGKTDIQNTELLAADLAADTLALIRPSGLGGGTGFSNTDREFVEKVSGGRITLDKASLERLAELHELAQTNIINSWNRTYKRLDAARMKELAMVPIELPVPFGTDEVPVEEDVPVEEGTPDDFAPAQAPAAALEYLRAHPETKEYFRQTFGYLPEGF